MRGYLGIFQHQRIGGNKYGNDAENPQASWE